VELCAKRLCEVEFLDARQNLKDFQRKRERGGGNCRQASPLKLPLRLKLLADRYATAEDLIIVLLILLLILAWRRVGTWFYI